MSRHLLSLNSVSLAFGGPAVLDDVSLSLESGERACITGRNGEGKSTLLRVIAGMLEPDTGEIVRAPGLKTGFLEQDVPHDRPGTVREVFEEDSDSSSDNGRYLTQLGVDPDAVFNSLSGGMRRRALLAKVLASKPDLVLLDEPTNHLDIDSIEWLENFIRRQTETAFLFVTHDRAFLKRVSNRVLDLDRGRLAGWNCDYSTFLKRKEELLADEEAMWEKKAKKLAVEEAWIRRGVKARTTRNQGRVEALRKLRLEFAARRGHAGKTNLAVDTAEQSGVRVIKVKGLSFSYPGSGRDVIHDFTADVLRGERIGLVGSNGAGKTTLLNLLTERLAPTAGSVDMGTRVKLAFFDQLRAQLSPEATVAEIVAKDRDTVTVNGVTKHVFAYLADFLFTPERSRTPVKALSGGEKARLLLARLFLEPSNLLVMDEPTNDLDVETLELLEERLLEYGGTLLVVSHDRVFLDNTVTSCFVLDGSGEVNVIAGGWTEASRFLEGRRAAAKAAADAEKAKAAAEEAASRQSDAPSGPKKLSYNEKRELEALPDRIEALEKEVAEIESAMSDGSMFAKDPKKAADMARRLPEAKAELESAVDRWAELSERA